MMATTDKFLLFDPKNCLPAEAIPSLLGRICDNPNRPAGNYFPDDPQSFHSKSAKPFHINATSPSIIIASSSDSLVRTLLADVFKAEREKAKSTEAEWHGERVRIFTLPQEKQVLENILAIAENKEKAEKWLDENESLYMVTGFLTMINAKCSLGTSAKRSIDTAANISKAFEAAILATGGVPINLPELSAQWKKQKEASSTWEATYAAEAVVAMRFRQLSRKWKILSLLKERKIKLSPYLDIRAGRMFRENVDAKVSPESLEWEEYVDNGKELADEEKQDVSLSPSPDVKFEEDDGNILVEFGGMAL